MNIEPEEIGPEVPEADALEQHTPVLPLIEEEPMEANRVPEGVPQEDFIDQRTDVQPGSADYDGIAATEAEAAEADLIEQARGLSADNEDEYPEAYEKGD
ncbi:hypothetical protein AB0O52_00785 [Arthrobacter sp. NPDC080073]|uniref:hypothetical protein n=1 Tax=Arthrobacter sp. NPDC080073 TaxID=3155919 RepID=UPI00342B4D96